MTLAKFESYPEPAPANGAALTVTEGSPARIAAIDVARGLGIIAVVAGHSIDTEKAIVTWIFAFHMPLFFMLSGFGAHYDAPAARYLAGKARALLLPYLATIALALAYWGLFYRHYANDPTEIGKMLSAVARQVLYASGVAVKQFEIGPVGPIWFLPALFAANVIGLLLDRATRGRYGHLFLALSVGAALLGLAIGRQIPLPLSFDVALVAQLFIAVGIFANRHGLFSRPPRPWQVAIALAAYLAGVWSGGISMNDRVYGNFLIPATGAIGGSFLVIWLSGLVARHELARAPLIYLGRAALVILAFHSFDTGFANLEVIFPRFYAVLEASPLAYTAYRIAFCVVIFEVVRRIPPLRALYSIRSERRD